jgi:dTDP-4-dehydrorhamnose reductase
MKIAIIGALGQLGTDVSEQCRKAGYQVIDLDVDDVDITNFDQLSQVLVTHKPDVVVNTAAFHHVEKCETEPDIAFRVNALGSRNLALLSLSMDFYLIHISTDYVFDGNSDKPYIESDMPKPLNVYANTKLSGEHFIQALAKKYLVMRTSGLYGKSPCRAKGGMNFVKLMLKLASEGKTIRVVDDEILTPTFTLEVARQIVNLISKPVYGLCHATAEGNCSWYEFAAAVFEIKGLTPDFNRALPGEFPVKVPRPKYSVLENKLLKDNNQNVFKHWKEALEEYLSDN